MAESKYFGVYQGPGAAISDQEKTEHRAAIEAASREAGEREMALMRSLSPPPRAMIEPPPLQAPVLALDFELRLEKIDHAIYGRGIPVDKAKLFALGKERFQKLLDLDRQARATQRLIGAELTTGADVLHAFAILGATEATGIPRQKTSEAYAGHGQDREAVRRIKHLDDLWKWTGEPQLVRAVFAYRDAFETLAFGRSLLEHIDQGRAYSQFFARGATGRKVALLGNWVSTLPGSIGHVAIVDPVTTLFSWLLNVKLMPPAPHDFFAERLATAHQKRYTEALWLGFLQGFSGWYLWEHIGRRTRHRAIGGTNSPVEQGISGGARFPPRMFRRSFTNKSATTGNSRAAHIADTSTPG